jgi:hypothetical protein
MAQSTKSSNPVDLPECYENTEEAFRSAIASVGLIIADVELGNYTADEAITRINSVLAETDAITLSEYENEK